MFSKVIGRIEAFYGYNQNAYTSIHTQQISLLNEIKDLVCVI